jgi:hypothetical protein
MVNEKLKRLKMAIVAPFKPSPHRKLKNVKD